LGFKKIFFCDCEATAEGLNRLILWGFSTSRAYATGFWRQKALRGPLTHFVTHTEIQVPNKSQKTRAKPIPTTIKYDPQQQTIKIHFFYQPPQKKIKINHGRRE
jgi:hypothetical protein